MTYGEIEFLPDPGSPPPAPPSHPADARRRAARLVSMVAWAAAAAFALLAPSHRVYEIVETSDDAASGVTSSTDSIDGWGRETFSSGEFAGRHLARYGIALCACAALFLVAAALGLVLHRRAEGGQPEGGDAQGLIRPASIGIGLAATSLLTGVLASVFLAAQAIVAAYAAASSRDNPGPRIGTADYGPFFGLALAALACALVAALAQYLALRRPARPAAMPMPAPVEPPELHDPEVELLA